MWSPLNGWRRLGLVIVSLWIIAASAMAIVEYTFNSGSVFVYLTIPDGTVVAGNRVTFPNGKVITLTEIDEFKLRLQAEQGRKLLELGRAVSPWELDWSNLEEVPKVNQVRWLRFAMVTVLAPLACWLVIEAFVLAVSWVRRGFNGTKHDT